MRMCEHFSSVFIYHIISGNRYVILFNKFEATASKAVSSSKDFWDWLYKLFIVLTFLNHLFHLPLPFPTPLLFFLNFMFNNWLNNWFDMGLNYISWRLSLWFYCYLGRQWRARTKWSDRNRRSCWGSWFCFTRTRTSIIRSKLWSNATATEPTKL